MNRVEIEQVVRAPREVAFARYTDHVGWSEWARIGRVSLVKQGRSERDGLGCVRSFSLFGLHEEVTEFERPQRMAYRIVRGGYPLKDHRAQVLFEPHADGTRIVWRTEFQPRVSLFGALTERAMRFGFSRVLSRFARHVERMA
jgi:hypothetical protein